MRITEVFYPFLQNKLHLNWVLAILKAPKWLLFILKWRLGESSNELLSFSEELSAFPVCRSNRINSKWLNDGNIRSMLKENFDWFVKGHLSSVIQMRSLWFFSLKIHESFEYAVLWVITFLQMPRSRIKIIIFDLMCTSQKPHS